MQLEKKYLLVSAFVDDVLDGSTCNNLPYKRPSTINALPFSVSYLKRASVEFIKSLHCVLGHEIGYESETHGFLRHSIDGHECFGERTETSEQFAEFLFRARIRQIANE